MKVLTIIFTSILLLFLLIVAPMYLPEKTDVLIIGAGATGMRAALEGVEYTDKVILLEKMPYTGGNSRRASAGINGVFNIGEMESYYRDTMEAGRFKGDPDLVRLVVENSGDALRWLIARGADLSDKGLLAGHSSSRTYRPSGGLPVGGEIVSVLTGQISRAGIDLRLENKALSIHQNAKSLTVEVENRTGREYRIKADSVIIATGGFGGNPVLVSRVNPELKGLNTTNSAGATGDFLELTRDMDVEIINLDDIQIHPTVEPDFSLLITEALRGNGGILINQQGKRFTNEMDFREVLSRKILEQENGTAWLVFDQEIRNSLLSVEFYFERELVLTAENLKNLAEKTGVPEKALREELTAWNRVVEEGEDTLFQRQDLIRPLQTPPYYAIRVTPGIHYCMGGLAIDEQARVLNRQGKAITGLYAAGETTGGIHGKDRLGGNSLADAMVFGKIAGFQAAQHALEQ